MAFSKKLGFKSNVVTHWESGRNWCATSVALQMANLAIPGGVEAICRWVVADWTDRVPAMSPNGVALLLNDLLRTNEPAKIAREVGVSRQTVCRWLRAAAEPNFLQFIGFLRAVGLLPFFLGFLDPALAKPGESTEALSRLAIEVRLVLDLPSYRELPHHDDAWVARELALGVAEARRGLEELAETGTITWVGTHWRRTSGEPPQACMNQVRGTRLDHRVRELAANGTFGVHYDVVCSVSESTLNEIRRVVFRASSDIAELLSGPRNWAERADRVVCVTLGQLALREQLLEGGSSSPTRLDAARSAALAGQVSERVQEARHLGAPARHGPTTLLARRLRR